MENLDGFLPAYVKIYETLYREIHGGDYSEGDQFYSESDLCKRFQVSRGTIRHALELLYQQGVLEKSRGKISRVINTRIEQNVQTLMGFTELMQRHGRKAGAILLEKKLVNPDQKTANLMNLPAGKKVVQITRVRTGDNEPMIIEHSWFNADLFQPIFNDDLEHQSIYKLFHKKTNQRLGIAKQTIEIGFAGQTESKYFDIRPGSPLLLFKRRIMTSDFRIFQYSEDMYRNDKVVFSIQTLPYDVTHESLTLTLKS